MVQWRVAWRRAARIFEKGRKGHWAVRACARRFYKRQKKPRWAKNGCRLKGWVEMRSFRWNTVLKKTVPPDVFVKGDGDEIDGKTRWPQEMWRHFNAIIGGIDYSEVLRLGDVRADVLKPRCDWKPEELSLHRYWRRK